MNRCPRLAEATVGIVVLFVLAGCGGTAPAPAPAPPPPTVSTTTSPTPTGPPTSAADGTDVGACRDGDCEIAVSRPTRIDLPLGAVFVTAVSDHGIELALPYQSDGVTGQGYTVSLDGYCSATSDYLRATHLTGYTPAVTTCQNVPPAPAPESDGPAKPNTLLMQTPGRAGTAIILRLHESPG